MPILKTEQETREIILPESGAKITLLNRITYGTMLKIWSENSDDKETRLAIAVAIITEWDFTDDKLEKLPITIENLEKLDKEDGEFLIKEVTASFESKKTLASK